MATYNKTSSTPISSDSPVLKLADERKSETLLRLTIRRFFKHKGAVFGLILLTLIMIFVIGGSFIYSEEYSNQISMNPADRFAAPNAEHLFGTDQNGRDVLARSIYGGQISLMIAVASISISISIGTLVGLVSGYTVGTKQGWIDSLLMRLVEALLSFPQLILLLILGRSMIGNTSVVNVLGRELSTTTVTIVLIIGLTSWMGLSRIVRAMVLSLREREFVLSARAIGATDRRIMFQHILPNCIAPIVVAATLGVGGAIITEAYLSFLGFGVQPPTATWGNILNRALDQIEEVWWMWVAPGTLIVMTVLAINFIGDGLRDALDPRSLK
jgi:peptide/nickel transport system permease protein